MSGFGAFLEGRNGRRTLSMTCLIGDSKEMATEQILSEGLGGKCVGLISR